MGWYNKTVQILSKSIVTSLKRAKCLAMQLTYLFLDFCFRGDAGRARSRRFHVDNVHFCVLRPVHGHQLQRAAAERYRKRRASHVQNGKSRRYCHYETDKI